MSYFNEKNEKNPAFQFTMTMFSSTKQRGSHSTRLQKFEKKDKGFWEAIDSKESKRKHSSFQ